MSDYFNLPQDLFLEILLKVPAEYLVKFTAVCKSWNSLIKNPSFISSHVQKTLSSSNSRRLLLFRRPSPSNKLVGFVQNYSLRLDNQDVDEYKQLHFPSVSTCSRVVGICNGLVCLVIEDYNFILWNPVIRKAIRLPKPSFRYYGEHFNGFGFDSKTKDYKILLYFGGLHDYSIEAYVYSLNANCWTSITPIAPKYSPIYGAAQYYYGNCFVNGAIHLLACDRENRNLIILAFDVSEQVFSEMPLPDHLSHAFFLDAHLLKYRQSSTVAMAWERERDPEPEWNRRWDLRREPNLRQIDLWVMKEYGVATSWTKVFTELTESVARVLFFRQDDKQVFVAREDGWIASLDIKTKHSKVSGVGSVHILKDHFVVDSYVDSLVLLDKYGNSLDEVYKWAGSEKKRKACWLHVNPCHCMKKRSDLSLKL